MKKALITGVTGQIGSYLADFLLEKGYEVHGIKRRTSTNCTSNINHLLDNNNFYLHSGDITDLSSLINIFSKVAPDEIYNMAAQSSIHVAWKQPILTSNITGLGALNVFEAARQVCPTARIYQASTSELFSCADKEQSESTVFNPQNPYAVAKLFAHYMGNIYARAYNMFICHGVSFNCESPRRGKEFATQKIITGVVNYVCGNCQPLIMGNIDSKRDFNHAKDIVRGIYLIMQHDKPDIFVLSSGNSTSIREFIEKAFKYFDIDVYWDKDINGLDIGYDFYGSVLVRTSPDYFRPLEARELLGCSAKAKEILHWEPEYTLEDIIKDMIENKLQEFTRKE